MATNFGSNVTQVAPVESSATPQEGVVKQPVLLAGLETVFDQATSAIKGARKSKEESAVGTFMEEQLKIADALEQGRISSSAVARSRSRALLLSAINANPLMASKYIEAQRGLEGLAGGADIIKEGTDEEKRKKARFDALVSNNYLDPSASDAEFEAADNEMRSAEAAKRIYDQRMQTINMESSLVSLDSAKRANLKAEREEATRDFLGASAPATYAKVTNDMNTILNSDASEAEKQQQIEEYAANFEAENAKLFADAGETTANAYRKAFTLIQENYLKRATGEFTDAELKRANDRILSMAKNSAFKNNTVVQLAVTKDILGDAATQQILTRNPELFTRYAEYIVSNDPNEGRTAANPYVRAANDKQAFDVYLKDITRTALSGDVNTANGGVAQLQTILGSIDDYSTLLAKDPQAGITLVNWMASPDFIKLRKAHPEAFSNIDVARSVIKENYDQEVWGMVQREFKNASVEIVPTGSRKDGSYEIPSDKAVGVRSTASGVEFFALDPNNRDYVQEAKRLNRELKPIINNTVKAGAHLEGRTDYGNVWDEVSDTILGTPMSGAAGGDTGDDLTPEDFAARYESMESLGGPAGDVVDAGKGYTTVKTSDGTVERRVGVRAWRNNNPGNIEYGGFAKSQGAIGSDGRFAIFPSYEAGRAAKANLLFESPAYSGKTIKTAIAKYAPSFENNTNAYVNSVARAVGVSPDTPLSSLSESERQIMLSAMEKVEGFKQGRVEVIGS